MDFLKNAKKGIEGAVSGVSNGIQLETLKKKRGDLVEDFKKVREKFEHATKYAADRTLLQSFLQSCIDQKVLISSKAAAITDGSSEQGLKDCYNRLIDPIEACIRTAEGSIANLDELTGGMNPEVFNILQQKYEQDLKDVDEKLTEVRKKVHS